VEADIAQRLVAAGVAFADVIETDHGQCKQAVNSEE
jgi:hypothetical protein